MRNARTLIATATVTLLAVAAAAAGLRASDAWVRIAPAGDVAAAYFTLHNESSKPVTLVGARAAGAMHAMIHESSLSAGQSRMRPRSELVVPPGGTVHFAPGGLHVMLSGFAHPLRAGDRVELELSLADGQVLTMNAIARSAATP